MMGIFDFFKRKRIKVNFNSEDLTEGEKLKAILNENAYLKGIITRIEAEKNKQQESQSETEKEKKKLVILNEQYNQKSKELQPLSLFSILYHNRIDKRVKNKIRFTTFDGGEDLGEVEDFVIMPDGGFGVVSNGQVIWGSSEINHVFYWITGLNNFAKNKIMPLCINSKGKFEPNIQTEECSELVRLTNGKFKINRFNKRPVHEMLSEDKEQINELNSELVHTEEIVSEQQKEINEKTREANLHRSRAEKSESELSSALDKVHEIEMANSDIVRQNMALVNIKEINEGLIESFDIAFKKLGTKIEDALGGPGREREWEDLKKKIGWAKENMGETKVYNTPEKEEKTPLSELRPTKP